jgi:hypothetical protein
MCDCGGVAPRACGSTACLRTPAPPLRVSISAASDVRLATDNVVRACARVQSCGLSVGCTGEHMQRAWCAMVSRLCSCVGAGCRPHHATQSKTHDGCSLVTTYGPARRCARALSAQPGRGKRALQPTSTPGWLLVMLQQRGGDVSVAHLWAHLRAALERSGARKRPQRPSQPNEPLAVRGRATRF